MSVLAVTNTARMRPRRGQWRVALPRWTYAVPLTRWIAAPFELLRECLRGATLLRSTAGNRLWLTLVEKRIMGRPARFKAPFAARRAGAAGRAVHGGAAR